MTQIKHAAAMGRPPQNTGSVGLDQPVRRQGQRDNVDPLLLERFDLPGRRGPPDIALRRLLIMNFARFVGKRGADVFGIFDDVVDQLGEHFAAKIGVLLWRALNGFPPRALGACAAAGADMGRMRQARDLAVAAQRADQQLVAELPLEIVA